jgi:WD40 repeat protein
MTSPRKTMPSNKLTDNNLSNQDTPVTFLLPDPDSPTPPIPVRPADWAFVPRTQIPHIPGYDVVDTLGRGGMGIVFKAHQRGLNRLVALKLILTGDQASKDELARFFQEAEAVGSLRHPNIVQVYEVGEHQGRHYLALEYVDGGTLAQHIQNQPQTPSFTAGICETIARAVYAVHSINIIHRDLKPANILLQSSKAAATVVDRRLNQGKNNFDIPVAKIADFGLAKRLDTDQHLTETGWIAGTPTYMAPEQVRGDRSRIGPAADLWAIGVIFYEMLTGRPPFQSDCSAKTLNQILHSEPESPSRLVRGVPRDLETICLKCLEKEPSRRYATGLALAEDLQRFRDGRPISARRINAVEQTWRWCGRNRLVAGLLACILVVLTIGTTVTTLYALRADENAQRANKLKVTAENNAEESRLRTREAEAATEAANQARADEAQQKEIANGLYLQAEEREKKGLRERYALDANVSMLAWQMGDAFPVKKFLEHYRPKNNSDTDLRGFEWYYLNRLCRPEIQSTLLGRPVQGVTLFAGGDGIAYGQDNNVCFHVPNRIVAPRVGQGHTNTVMGVATNPKTGDIASASRDGTVRIWNPGNSTSKQILRGKVEEVFGVVYTPDGKTLISWGGSHSGLMRRGEMVMWDVESGKMKHSIQKHESAVEGVAISRDGTLIASCGYDRSIHLHEVATGKYLRGWAIRGGMVSIAMHPDKKWIAIGTTDGIVALYDPMNGKLLRELQGHTNYIASIELTHDGTILASASFDGNVRIWEPDSGRMIQNIRAHDGRVTALKFQPNNRNLVSVGFDCYARVWDLLNNPEYKQMDFGQGALMSLVQARDPNRAFSIEEFGRLTQWDLKSGHQIPYPLKDLALPNGKFIWDAVLLPDGDTLALRMAGFTDIEYRSLTGLKLPPALEQMKKGHALAASPNKKWLAVVRDAGTVDIQDLGQPFKPTTLNLKVFATAIAFSAGDSPLLAVAHGNSEIVLVHPDGKSAGNIKLEPGMNVNNLAFSPDGSTLAGSDMQLRIHLWDVKTGAKLWHSDIHSRAITALSFSPSGDRILTASADCTIKMLEVSTGRETITLRGHHRQVTKAMFTPDGGSIISLGMDYRILRWEGRPNLPAIATPK